jgi:hypothetical protein
MFKAAIRFTEKYNQTTIRLRKARTKIYEEVHNGKGG